MNVKPQIDRVLELEEDQRRARILEGAMKVFLAYGFQRTTMDDIARAAEISRPSLYLQFRNKADIYRALAERFVESALAQSAVALGAEGSLEARLGGAVASFLDLLQEVEQAPHGHEILDMKSSLAADIVGRARTEMGAMMENTIRAEAGKQGRRAGCALSAELLADLLLDAIDGLKARRQPWDKQRRAAASYVRLVAELANPASPPGSDG